MQRQAFGSKEKPKSVLATPFPKPSDDQRLVRKAPGIHPAVYCQEKKDTPLVTFFNGCQVWFE